MHPSSLHTAGSPRAWEEERSILRRAILLSKAGRLKSLREGRLLVLGKMQQKEIKFLCLIISMISMKEHSWKSPCTTNCCHGLRLLTTRHLFRAMIVLLPRCT